MVSIVHLRIHKCWYSDESDQSHVQQTFKSPDFLLHHFCAPFEAQHWCTRAGPAIIIRLRLGIWTLGHWSIKPERFLKVSVGFSKKAQEGTRMWIQHCETRIKYMTSQHIHRFISLQTIRSSGEGKLWSCHGQDSMGFPWMIIDAARWELIIGRLCDGKCPQQTRAWSKWPWDPTKSIYVHQEYRAPTSKWSYNHDWAEISWLHSHLLEHWILLTTINHAVNHGTY